MSNGRRYEKETPKLNIKKVIAVIIAIAVITMAIIGINKLIKGGKEKDGKTIANKYLAVYTEGKWGVINSQGQTIIEPSYEEAIIIPNSSKELFICAYDVNYNQNTYKTKVLNSKGEEVITGYDTVQAVENYDTNNNLWYEEDILIVSKDGKYGLIDFAGKELLKCEYDSVSALKGVKNSILTVKDGKQGLKDRIGATITENEYKSIKAIGDQYENGYIVQAQDGKYGVIGGNKTKVLDTKYEEIKQIYGNGKYVVKENGKWKIIDTEEKSYLEGKFEDVKSINGENVIIKEKNKYGVVTLNGETKIKPNYQEINYAFGDNYIVNNSGKYSVINTEGKILIKDEYSNIIYREKEGFFEASKPSSAENDLIDRQFDLKLTGIVSEINEALGYMKVRVDGDYKYYNFQFEEKQNKDILKTNTLFLDKKDGKYGFIDSNGVVVVDYIYDDAREQNEFGYASIKKDGMWGCIDLKGNVAMTPAYKLEHNSLIEFIGKWHIGEDLNLNYYTDK